MIPAAQPPTKIGRYELGAVIGRGAFGLVYRARDHGTGEDRGPEAASSGCAGGDWSRRAVPARAQDAAGLRHPHIVAVYDVGQFNGEPYLVSTLIEGKNLADHALRATAEPSPGRRMGCHAGRCAGACP